MRQHNRTNIIGDSFIEAKAESLPYYIKFPFFCEKLGLLVFEKCAKAVRDFVLLHSGNPDDAEDVLHDGFLFFSDQKWQRKLLLGTLTSAFIISTCRNLWLKEVERRKVLVCLLPDNLNITNVDEEEVFDIRQKRYNFFRMYFNRMNDESKKIILASFNQIPVKVMAEKLGYSANNYRKRKERCLKTLIKKIKKDPKYITLING